MDIADIGNIRKINDHRLELKITAFEIITLYSDNTEPTF